MCAAKPSRVAAANVSMNEVAFSSKSVLACRGSSAQFFLLAFFNFNRFFTAEHLGLLGRSQSSRRIRFGFGRRLVHWLGCRVHPKRLPQRVNQKATANDSPPFHFFNVLDEWIWCSALLTMTDSMNAFDCADDVS